MRRIAFMLIFVHGIVLALSAQNESLKLWYDKPASTWTEALPIGNGRLGAMVFGGVTEERLQFNEETVWTGSPRDHSREGAAAYLSELRELLASGKQAEAEALALKHFMGRKQNEESYDSLKKVWLTKMMKDQTPASADFRDGDWATMKLPVENGWESTGLEGLDGAVWFRTSFELPKGWQGKNVVLSLGRVRDLDVTFVNGSKIGSTEGPGNRGYVIPKSQLRAGKNVIAVQVFNFYDKGGLVGARDQKDFWLYPEGEDLEKGIALTDEWRYKIYHEQPPAFPRYQADYQPFGDVLLQFKNSNSPITNYRRELDIENAIASVQYSQEGVNYTRSYFASAPGQGIVTRITADQRGKISLRASLKSLHRQSGVIRHDHGTLKLSIQVKNGAIHGVSYLSAEVRGGTVSTHDGTIEIENADDVVLYLVASTNFVNYNDVTGNSDKCRAGLTHFSGKKYETLKQEHIRDYQQYFKTFTLDLGHSENEKLPTDQRLWKYTSTADPALITLYLQYARYLLISSSRPGTQPANLQGIWNPLLNPPWGSKYTTNINVQMNYWPTDVLNLSSCFDPLLSMIKDVSETGGATARNHYQAPGWVLHHNTDLWRGTAPINAANHGIWVTGGAWLSNQLWDHYKFTQDATFLQKWYPVMKGAAEFFVHFLSRDERTGFLISTPSNSPEQGGLVAGPTMDHQIIRDLFKNTATAATLLGVDVEFREHLQTLYGQIAPNKIGRHGQLQEWLEDKDDPSNKHRHVSHLWGVYPGTDLSWENPGLMNAARQSLMDRGDGGTGWSLAWKVNLWARFKEGDHALLMIDKLLAPAIDSAGRERGGAYNNLFDAHPPFQIDGNFGGAAGIAEMLIQSHMPYIELLPALPTSFRKGEIKGVRARGNFVMMIQWDDHRLKKVQLTSLGGAPCFLKYGKKEIRFNTQPGKSYTLNGDLVITGN